MVTPARDGHHATIMNGNREITSPAFEFSESVEGYENAIRRKSKLIPLVIRCLVREHQLLLLYVPNVYGVS